MKYDLPLETTAAESLAMQPDVIRFCYYMISTDENLERMAMRCGGYNALINETWVKISKGTKQSLALRWTTVWGNALRWVAFGICKRINQKDWPVRYVNGVRDCYLVEYHDPYLVRAVRRSLLLHLTRLERLVIRLRFGFYDNESYTLEEVGHVLGSTREWVRQMEYRARKKLGRPFVFLDRFVE